MTNTLYRLRDLVTHFILQSLSMQDIKWFLICNVLKLNTLVAGLEISVPMHINHNGSEYHIDPEKANAYRKTNVSCMCSPDILCNVEEVQHLL